MGIAGAKSSWFEDTKDLTLLFSKKMGTDEWSFIRLSRVHCRLRILSSFLNKVAQDGL